jgi:uncharacterized membrane protein
MGSVDLGFFFQWYITILVLGVLFFPLTSAVFSRFSDKGYPLAKMLGLGFTTYVVFNLGLARILQFNSLTIIIVICLISLVSSFIVIRKTGLSKKKIVVFLKSKWKLLLFEEVLFLVTLYFLSYIRAFSPDIHGLEKYMDFGFINSINRSDFFPPKDMWFTPFSINYYYFGHLATAVLTKISFLKTNITYNLMLATIFAMCVTASFSIAINLISNVTQRLPRKAYFFALISVLVVSVGGNLHTIYSFFTPYENENPVPPWELTFNPTEFPNSYWYPNATRFIYNTIHEFPMYSWTVSDLHGHVLDIPFVLLTIAVLLSYSFRIFQNEPLSTKVSLRYLILIGFLLSVMYMTNAWDGIIYFLLSAFVISYFLWGGTKNNTNIISSSFLSLIRAGEKLKNKKVITWILECSLQLSVIALCLFFFTLPFSLSFKPFISGIGVLCAPNFLTEIGRMGPFLFEKDHCQHSMWWQILILYGFFYFFVVSFLLFLWRTKKIIFSDNFVLILILLSTLLILIPEFIYAKDIYPGHYRANTMFKLVFQSFMMLSIGTGYILFRIFHFAKENKKGKNIFVIAFFILSSIFLGLVLIYPFQAVNSYYGELKTYKGLNGTEYLKSLYPDDYRAINFLNSTVSGQPVIVEAQGDAYNGSSSYTDYARVSANTGLPTVLGWTVHEWLWRGTYDIPAPRIEEVRLVYESENIAETLRILQKYDVSYVFVGELEREKYPLLTEEKFSEIGEVIFREGETAIYKLRPFTPSS